MDDAAVRLGRRLLASKQLTQAQVKAAVEEAREEQRREDKRLRLRKLAQDMLFAVRLSDEAKRTAEVLRIAKLMQEVCGGE